VKSTTPFLPGISPKYEGRSRRCQLDVIRKFRDKLLSKSISDLGVLFAEILPPELLSQAGKEIRRRVFPEEITFWAWVSQLLEGNSSCANALTLIQGWYSDADLAVPSFDTSSYCRARQRLSEEFLNVIASRTKEYAQARIESHHLWYGHRLKAIDGTTVKLMDTVKNQAEFPQPSGQKPGCGFPVMGIVGVLDLATGRLEDYVIGKDRDHDATGLYRLCGQFNPGDIVIADRAFCGYELIAKLLGNDVHSVMRLHQMREKKLDWRKGKKLDPDSRLVTWSKPPKPGKSGITEQEWKALPETMQVRLVRTRGIGRDGKPRTMYLVTTLLEANEYPTDEIGMLYAERWKIEVKFRDIKTTMKVEMFRVQSPAMARKMMRMVQLAYNLIKAIQMEAIRGEAVLIDELGFKGSMDVLNEFRSRFRGLQTKPRKAGEKRTEFERRVLERILRIRPNRREPRAVKTRPKPYQYLSAPRREFIEIQHRSNYRSVA